MNRRLAFLILTLAVNAMGADWPQWRGPTRNGYAGPEEAALRKLPESPAVVWSIKTGFGLDSPVTAGGKVFFSQEKEGKEVATAVEATTGKILWTTEIDDTFKDSQSQPGPRCTALVDGKLVYFQSCRGQLRCLSTADGSEVWSTQYGKDFGATFTGEKGKAEGSTRHGNTDSPLIDGDQLIAGTGGKDAGFTCFDKTTGKVAWKAPLEDLPAYAAPVIAEIAGVRQVVAFTTSALTGIDRASGKVLWRVPMKTSLGRHVTTPTVIGDIVVVGSFQLGLIGVHVTRAQGSFKAEQAWLTKDAMPNFSSPVAVGHSVIGVGQGLKIFCVDADTGAVNWSADASLGKQHAGIIAVGTSILALGDAGDLVAFDASTTAYTELGRAKVCDKNWCTPAYVGGQIFVRDGHEVRCVSLTMQK